MPIDLEAYERMSKVDLQKSMMNAVRSVADGEPLSEANFSPKRQRAKRQFTPGADIVGHSIILGKCSD
jgi:hypothetical protein